MEWSPSIWTGVVSANACTYGTDCKLLLNFETWHTLSSFWLDGSACVATGCNLFHDAACCASRERLRPIDLSERCIAYRCGEVDVCTPPEPHGLGDGMLKCLEWSWHVLWPLRWR